MYVGSACNLATRWRYHRWQLRKETHANTHLLRAWQKYGEDSFLFEVLEYVPEKASLLEREQHWLDQLESANPHFGFNICEKAESHLGVKRSEATKEKLRRAWDRQRGTDRRTPEGKESSARHARAAWAGPDRRANILAAITAGMRTPEQTARKAKVARRRMAEGHYPTPPRDYVLTAPDGTIHRITNLAQFCREQGLTQACMAAVARGKSRQHKGWLVKYADPPAEN